MDSVFGPIFDAIAWMLAQLYSVVPDLGISIILLTVVIMLILYPLTAKQAKSMMAMQRVQPQIKKLQAKYKGDRAKLNEEMMKFYQENKINPLAGCLPLLVQMPIFISLFNVLRNAYKYVPTSSKLYTALCDGFGTRKADGSLSKCGADVTSALHSQFPGFKTGDTLVHHLGFIDKGFLDLRLTATDSHGSLLSASPYFALVIVVMVTGFLQSRQAQRRTPQANKQMATVMKVLPIFFGLISLQFPAGLVLYFFVSNLWRLGQQELIFRRHGSALTPAKGALDVKSTERPARAAAVAEIDAPDTDAPDTDADEVPTPAPVPKVKAPTPQPAAARPASGQKAGGLRGMFSMPPPPEFNGGGSSTSASSAPRTTSGSGSASASAAAAAERAASNRRRRNKKKRKR